MVGNHLRILPAQMGVSKNWGRPFLRVLDVLGSILGAPVFETSPIELYLQQAPGSFSSVLSSCIGFSSAIQ